MEKPPCPALLSVLILLLLAATPCVARPQATGPGFLAELSAGPLLGIDQPLKGCSAGLFLGLELPPFELGLRGGAAYDSSLGAGLLRLDVELGLGGGLRAIVGGLLPLGDISLPDPSGTWTRGVPVEAASWPDRFGLSSTLLVLPKRILGARLSIDAELVYTDYRLPWQGVAGAGGQAAPLSGAAAFAAGVEASLCIRLRWPAERN